MSSVPFVSPGLSLGSNSSTRPPRCQGSDFHSSVSRSALQSPQSHSLPLPSVVFSAGAEGSALSVATASPAARSSLSALSTSSGDSDPISRELSGSLQHDRDAPASPTTPQSAEHSPFPRHSDGAMQASPSDQHHSTTGDSTHARDSTSSAAAAASHPVFSFMNHGPSSAASSPPYSPPRTILRNVSGTASVFSEASTLSSPSPPLPSSHLPHHVSEQQQQQSRVAVDKAQPPSQSRHHPTLTATSELSQASFVGPVKPSEVIVHSLTCTCDECKPIFAFNAAFAKQQLSSQGGSGAGGANSTIATPYGAAGSTNALAVMGDTFSQMSLHSFTCTCPKPVVVKTRGRLPYFVAVKCSKAPVHYPSFYIIQDLLVARGWGVTTWDDPEVNLLIALKLEFSFSDMDIGSDATVATSAEAKSTAVAAAADGVVASVPHGRRNGFPRIINYFHGYSELTKLGVLWNMRKLAEQQSQISRAAAENVLALMPLSFWISSVDYSNDEKKAALQRHERFEIQRSFDRFQREGSTRNVWMLKPGYGHKGNGIKVFTEVSKLLSYVDTLEGTEWVAQKYIERPLLVGGRKFDLRVFALLAPDFKLYMYQNGILRMSSLAYSLDDLDNRYIHLTNHCIQKTSKQYGSHEAGNEIFFPQFNKYLSEHYTDPAHPRSVEKDVIPAIENVIITSMKSVQRFMLPQRDYMTYQMLGYDILLDDDFNAYLLEVNTTPGCAKDFRQPMYQALLEVLGAFYPGTLDGPAAQVDPSLRNSWTMIHDFAPAVRGSAS